jgi:hypothetical protein
MGSQRQELELEQERLGQERKMKMRHQKKSRSKRVERVWQNLLIVRMQSRRMEMKMLQEQVLPGYLVL